MSKQSLCAVLAAAAIAVLALLPGDAAAGTTWTQISSDFSSSIAVPTVGNRRRRPVRFSITVSKAELLKAPFSTAGGNRLANTRLRVWLTTASGQRLTVRDGRIAVSIARIKSGALPGLGGIL